jgi:hypothetical protein
MNMKFKQEHLFEKVVGALLLGLISLQAYQTRTMFKNEAELQLVEQKLDQIEASRQKIVEMVLQHEREINTLKEHEK